MSIVECESVPFVHEELVAPADIADTHAHVVSNEPVNAEYYLMVLAVSGLALNARAGQFFNIHCPTTATDMPFLRRPMSVYRVAPEKRQIEFLYKVTGAGTRAMATLEPGNTIAVLGPLGNGFTLQTDWKHIVVLGRGVGLATLAPLAELALSHDVGVTAILSARSPSYVMSADRFATAGCSVVVATDTDGTSDPKNIERILRDLKGRGKADAFFTCGSNRLMQLMKRLGAELRIPGEVAMEQQMACGLGMCFCCVRTFEGKEGKEPRRVCCEGPVFKLEEALSW
jgi:dihydroorotate dehydrogenase electron transfer subunit